MYVRYDIRLSVARIFLVMSLDSTLHGFIDMFCFQFLFQMSKVRKTVSKTLPNNIIRFPFVSVRRPSDALIDSVVSTKHGFVVTVDQSELAGRNDMAQVLVQRDMARLAQLTHPQIVQFLQDRHLL